MKEGKVEKQQKTHKERARILGKQSVSMASDISVQTRRPVNQADAGLAETHTLSHKHTPTFTQEHICLLIDLQKQSQRTCAITVHFTVMGNRV